MSLSISPSRRKRAAGVMLFLAVTAGWTVGLASAERNWVAFDDGVLLIASAASALSVVVTGYLGRVWDALWLGWLPGATIMAAGFAMTPDPGGDETGGAMVFAGGLLLVFDWPAYFFPLIATGVWLRRRRARRLARSAP